MPLAVVRRRFEPLEQTQEPGSLGDQPLGRLETAVEFRRAGLEGRDAPPVRSGRLARSPTVLGGHRYDSLDIGIVWILGNAVARDKLQFGVIYADHFGRPGS